uniref:Uncharacterized protein n=2 Tax=Vibrio algicola TaxID=2662262 RepID=A0A5Q0TGL7_9VIBR
MMKITVSGGELFSALRGEGFTTAKIQQFIRVFDVEHTMVDSYFALDSDRAMLVNTNGAKQGLTLPEFIKMWWVFWMVVFNTSDNNRDLEQQALGAIRALTFVSMYCKNMTLTNDMKTWWVQTDMIHGHKNLEVM